MPALSGTSNTVSQKIKLTWTCRAKTACLTYTANRETL